MGWAIAWLAATGLHAGFQLTVTLVVYPAFRRVPAAAWTDFHAGHSRGIAPLVGVLYGGLLVTGVGVLVAGPLDVALLVALAGVGVALATTALVAAPTHGRLGGGPDPALLRRLLAADVVRTLGALVGLAGALAHLVTGA
ncbi:hypothetical protein [Nocardioides sp. CFH 31398]|uniref:hypothetical protein n=1 Tax=Nocardioides sp. CFH 31398 TaxID=2919579 RepID=UPI001F062C2E|nr:hypothetical protein [Nocardioides sp. CFH 31398]MCH1865800.1 hypothetical protein [Nocardioides sp. CFH 31398]